MEKFDEYSEKGLEIQRFVEMFLVGLTQNYDVSLREPAHDVARRFLSELSEFIAFEMVV